VASEKILKVKNEVVKEIAECIKNSQSVIIFSYQGLTVSMISDLRNKLKDVNATMKVYKNTLTTSALDELKINLDDFMTGPNAIVFSENLLEPIKVISDFAKSNKKLEIRVGIISGEVADLDTIKEYANIPSREGLLTMLAGGMIQFVKELSIGLNLYAVQLNDGKPIDEPKEEPAPVKEEAPTPEESTEEEKTEIVETPKEESPVVEEAVETVEETPAEEVAEETPTPIEENPIVEEPVEKVEEISVPEVPEEIELPKMAEPEVINEEVVEAKEILEVDTPEEPKEN